MSISSSARMLCDAVWGWSIGLSRNKKKTHLSHRRQERSVRFWPLSSTVVGLDDVYQFTCALLSSACFDDTTKAGKSQEVETRWISAWFSFWATTTRKENGNKLKKRSFLPSTSGLDVYGNDGQHAQQPAAQKPVATTGQEPEQSGQVHSHDLPLSGNIFSEMCK